MREVRSAYSCSGRSYLWPAGGDESCLFVQLPGDEKLRRMTRPACENRGAAKPTITHTRQALRHLSTLVRYSLHLFQDVVVAGPRSPSASLIRAFKSC